MDIQPKFGVAQLGARMHYAVPAAFQKFGLLHRFTTDFWKPSSGLLLPLLFEAFPALHSRHHAEIPDSTVSSFPFLGFNYALALRQAKTKADQTKAFLTYSSRFAKKSVPLLAHCDLIYTFNSAGLKLLQSKTKNSFIVVEQTLAPRISERQLLADLPGFEKDGYSTAYEDRERQEWELADLIVCGSEFVRQELILHQAQQDKIVVIPYGYGSSENIAMPKKHHTNTPLKLLFIGNGALRKGLTDLLEAVSELPNQVELTVVGQMQLPAGFDVKRPPNVHFLGAVARAEISQLYASHDIFVLPSLCEGSATVTYEALHHGLPVICTPNTGSVVTDFFDGRIVPIRDPKQIKDAIVWFLENNRLETVSRNALETSRSYTADSYGTRLVEVLLTRYRAAKG